MEAKFANIPLRYLLAVNKKRMGRKTNVTLPKQAHFPNSAALPQSFPSRIFVPKKKRNVDRDPINSIYEGDDLL